MIKNFPLARVIENVGVTRDELINNTIPPVEKLIKAIPDARDYGSQTFELYNQAILRELSGARNGLMFHPILEALRNGVEVLSFVDAQLSADFSDNVTQSSITLTRATTLQLLDTVNFVARYTRRLCDVIFIAETNKKVVPDGNELAGVTAAEIEFLASGRDRYIRSLKIIAKPIGSIEDAYKQIPEVVVADMKSGVISALHGNDKMDPLQFGLIQSKADPIWVLGNIYVQYQARRYKTAKEEKAILELRIERYKAILANKPDPKMASIIEKREAELDRMRGQLAKMEADL